LDATRCISYLTIEQSEAVDPELADKTHGWLFGCDICQEVCPWNRKSWVSSDATWQPQNEYQLLDTLRILQLSQEEFDQTYGQTALGRSGLPGLMRNAILVAGWQRWGEATSALIALLTHHQSVIRISTAWALGRIGGEAAVTALQRAIASEANQEVRIAMQRALC
jgi:epoxyqueuosine reductase